MTTSREEERRAAEVIACALREFAHKTGRAADYKAAQQAHAFAATVTEPARAQWHMATAVDLGKAVEEIRAETLSFIELRAEIATLHDHLYTLEANKGAVAELLQRCLPFLQTRDPDSSERKLAGEITRLIGPMR